MPTKQEAEQFNGSPDGKVTPLTRQAIMQRTLRPMELAEEMTKLYREGVPVAPGTGFATLDVRYRPAPGQLTVVTGYPGSGKSELLDQVVLNLVRRHDWRVAYYSPENYPHSWHAMKLVEKIVGKPMLRGPTDRMTEQELANAMLWLDERVGFIRQTQRQANDVESILRECWEWAIFYTGHPIGIVLDPWNEVEHCRSRNQSETEYVSDALSKVRRFARVNNCHVWLVAHPAKVLRDRDGKRPVPTPSDISGSAHFWNKADNAFTVHRPDVKSDLVEIHVQKVRFKWCGSPGLVELRYDRVTGRYHETNQGSAYRAASDGDE